MAVLVACSPRLVALGRGVAAQRRAGSVKAAAMALTYFVQTARVPVPALSARLLEAAVGHLDPAPLVTYQGKVLVVLDPTVYEKRSPERGKWGRPMEHIGRVRRAKSRPSTQQSTWPAQQGGGGSGQKDDRRTATTPGYVEVWAGLVVRGKRFLPLARQLFSSRHPQCTSHNAVEAAVLAQALALLHRLGLSAIVLGAKGLGRKELVIRLGGKTIENKSHWVRDVTFDEGRSQIRSGAIPQVMAALRIATIGLLRCAGVTTIAAACRHYAAQPWAALTLLGSDLRTK